MKRTDLLAAGLALAFLGAATPAGERTSQPTPAPAGSSPASPAPPGKDNKPLLQIVRGDSRTVENRPPREEPAEPACPPRPRPEKPAVEKRILVIWLLELTADIGLEEKAIIDRAWYSVGATTGPVAYFFDHDNVVLFFRELKSEGKLLYGKKGD